MSETTLRCYLVEKSASGDITAQLTSQPLSKLGETGVLIRVHSSSLNYKDAMAATGHRGIVRTFPHVPGIDAAGIVEVSDDPRFQPGDQVIATGHELGVERWGAWASHVRVPGDWIVPLPSGLTLEESMIFGTAGFTAAQCVQALQLNSVDPSSGKILLTGATGGVGILSLMILSGLGYEVVAVSGKPEEQQRLKDLGASEVRGREFLVDVPDKPLLRTEFAGGIDTVGGSALAAMCRMIQHRGAVACCGMVAGSELNLTVFPFILRGLTLAGIDSAWCPDDERAEIWKKLADEWKPENLASIATTVPLSDIGQAVDAMLKGQHRGRTVVVPSTNTQ